MQQKNTQVYIVRLWKEAKNSQPWRGKIQNVRSGQSLSVSNLNELAELLRRYFSEEAKPRPEPEKGLK